MNVEFLKRVGLTLNEMLISESERILDELEKDGNHKLKVNLSIALDTSTPIPYAGVKIRYAPQAFTDLRAILGEDPNQPGLPLGESGAIDPSAEDRMGEQPVVVKRKRGRPEGSKNKKKSNLSGSGTFTVKAATAEDYTPPVGHVVEVTHDSQPATE